MKPELKKLLKNFQVRWNDCEFGAPEINPKRPYGNSDVEQDMLEILGLKKIGERIYEFTLNGVVWILKGEEGCIYLDGPDEEQLCNELNKLHKETEQALIEILDNL